MNTLTSSLSKKELSAVIQRAYYVNKNQIADNNLYARKLMNFPKQVLQRAAYFAVEYLTDKEDDMVKELDFNSMTSSLVSFTADTNKKEHLRSLNIPKEFSSRFQEVPSWFMYYIPE
jgi:hypothetical protein